MVHSLAEIKWPVFFFCDNGSDGCILAGQLALILPIVVMPTYKAAKDLQKTCDEVIKQDKV